MWLVMGSGSKCLPGWATLPGEPGPLVSGTVFCLPKSCPSERVFPLWVSPLCTFCSYSTRLTALFLFHWERERRGSLFSLGFDLAERDEVGMMGEGGSSLWKNRVLCLSSVTSQSFIFVKGCVFWIIVLGFCLLPRAAKPQFSFHLALAAADEPGRWNGTQASFSFLTLLKLPLVPFQTELKLKKAKWKE